MSESVGNSTRIDYGSGHEMSFVMFMYCLFKIGYLKLDDQAAAGIVLFERYAISTLPASHSTFSFSDNIFIVFI